MTVTKEITRLEKSSVKLSITVAKDDVRSEYDDLLREYTKSIQIPGFRKGKVPRDVLVRKFGEALKGEALGKIIEKCLTDIFQDESFPRGDRPLPYSTPQLQEEPEVNFDADLGFSVVYDVLPAVKVENWQGLEVEIPDISIGEEDLSRELEVIRDRNSIVLDKDDNEGAARDDVVTVDYWELDDSGQVIPGGEREDFTFTLGSGYNYYGFDDDLIGMKKNDTVEFTKTYGGEIDNKELADKTKKLRVTLKALKVKKLPDLDDDLAQDVDEKFQTLEDLKNSIRERLNNDLDSRLRNMKINKILEKIMENTPVEIPESMLRMELDSRWRNLARRFNTDGDGLLKMMGSAGTGAEAIMEEWKPDAQKALHSRLIVETLMEEQKYEVTDEDVEGEISKIAEESGSPTDEVKKYYETEEMKEYIREEIKERHIFDILLEKNTVKTGARQSYVDLTGNSR